MAHRLDFCTLKAVKGTIVNCALSKTKDNMFDSLFDPSILVSVHLSKFDWAVFLNYSVFFNQFYNLIFTHPLSAKIQGVPQNMKKISRSKSSQIIYGIVRQSKFIRFY